MKIVKTVGLAIALVLAGIAIAWPQMGNGLSSMMDQGKKGYSWFGPMERTGWHSMGFSVAGLTLTKEQAAQVAEAHLQALGNPNLKLGALREFEGNYEASIVTKEGSLAEKLLVDKRTGWVGSVY